MHSIHKKYSLVRSRAILSLCSLEEKNRAEAYCHNTNSGGIQNPFPINNGQGGGRRGRRGDYSLKVRQLFSY